MTFQLPVSLIEKARDVVFFSPGLTMASFMEEALVAQLKRRRRSTASRFRRAGFIPSSRAICTCACDK